MIPTPEEEEQIACERYSIQTISNPEQRYEERLWNQECFFKKYGDSSESRSSWSRILQLCIEQHKKDKVATTI